MIGNRIVVTGGDGFLGKHVVNFLRVRYPNAEIVVPCISNIDLRERNETISYFIKIKADFVIALAARLGGIGDNQKYPASYFYDNITIGINTIDACRLSGVKKLIIIGTVCSYPKLTPVPFKEEDLWNGYPEPTNGPYGIAKKAVAEYSISVQKQYGLNSVNLLMTNLYGPGDDFRDATSHVIPALIKKIIHAKEACLNSISAWGDGSPTRDFIYVTDAAKAIVTSLEIDYIQPINIGGGSDISIKKLFELICTIVGFKGTVIWDSTRPNGQPKRLLDIAKAKQHLGFLPEVDLETGLKQTIEWYLDNRTIIDNLNPKYSNEK